jgi:hypothetical protein
MGLAACHDSDDSREAPRALQKMGLLKKAWEGKVAEELIVPYSIAWDFVLWGMADREALEGEVSEGCVP